MKKILTEALAVGNATSRSLFMNPREPTWFYYPGSAWWNLLFETGYQFDTHPADHARGCEALRVDWLSDARRAHKFLLLRYRDLTGHGHAAAGRAIGREPEGL